MFKLMHKKLNKKGFTLAELLVVVAIVAILVAIAIPIFTNSIERAQIATNKANIRSTKAAAIAMILEKWDQNDSGTGKKMRDGIETGTAGWIASGIVDAEGNITFVGVHVNPVSNTYYLNAELGYVKQLTATEAASSSSLNYDWGSTEGIVKVEESGFVAPPYVTTVYIKPAEVTGGKTA